RSASPPDYRRTGRQRLHGLLRLAVAALIPTLLSLGAAGQAAAPPRHFASPEAELDAGIALTRQGKYRQAIPLLRDARPKVQDVFSAGFDLALCYTAVGENQQALTLLDQLPAAPTLAKRADVDNLRAQVAIGLGDTAAAADAFSRAAALEPRHLPLYLFLADACVQHHEYPLGLRVVNAGLAQLPDSARLHYERAVLEEDSNQPRRAARDWRAAATLGAGKAIGYMAGAQAAVAAARFPAALATARAGLARHPNSVLLLTIFGQAALRSGARPGQPLFGAAGRRLRHAVALQPGNAAAQLALGWWEMTAGRMAAALRHLNAARAAAPNDPAVYARLAAAYQRMGMQPQAAAARARLAALNRAQAASYRAPAATHAGYEAGPH
ncbi:MAG: tetratricopeptide repeat protein, partial [Terriglobales bacterium]